MKYLPLLVFILSLSDTLAQDKSGIVRIIGSPVRRAVAIAEEMSDSPPYIKRYNGAITDIIFTKKYNYLRPLGINAAEVISYHIEGDTISFVVTEYSDISIEQVRAYYDSVSLKYSGYYFTYVADTRYYTQVYLDKGYPIAITRLVDPNKMPKKIRTWLKQH